MILLVEDDVITRSSFAQLLRANGHEVVESGDGNEALVFLQTLSIDLVVTDLVVPNVNGLNLTSGGSVLMQGRSSSIVEIARIAVVDKCLRNSQS
jgi:CheY-like chemotaxis protein